MLKTAQWLASNFRFAGADPVSRACKELGMSLDQAMPLIVAMNSGERLARPDQKKAEKFIRTLSHYIHPEGVSAILRSWMPIPAPEEQAYESRLKLADGSPRDQQPGREGVAGLRPFLVPGKKSCQGTVGTRSPERRGDDGIHQIHALSEKVYQS